MKIHKLKGTIDYKWYSVEVYGDDKKWKDAGDIYTANTKEECRKEIVFINFHGRCVRMIEHTCICRPIGTTKDFR